MEPLEPPVGEHIRVLRTSLSAQAQVQVQTLAAVDGLVLQLAEEADRLQAERERLSAERSVLEAWRQQLAKEASFVAENSFSPEDIVTLNVGGRIFQTTQKTLCKIKGSMLAAWFSGRHTLVRDGNGHVFIDRDPNMFEIVLGYLRDGRKMHLDLTDEAKMEHLANEFDYFCIPHPWGESTLVAEYEYGSTIHVLQGHQKVVLSVDTDGSRIFCGHSDGKVRMWGCPEGNLIGCADGHQKVVCSVKLLNGYGISGSMDLNVKIWRQGGPGAGNNGENGGDGANSGLECAQTLSHPGGVRGMAVKEGFIAAIGRAGSQRLVRVWRLNGVEPNGNYDIHLGQPYSHLSNYVGIVGGCIVTDHRDGLALYSVDDGNLVRVVNSEAVITKVVTMQDRLVLVVGAASEKMLTCNVESGVLEVCSIAPKDYDFFLGSIDDMLLVVKAHTRERVDEQGELKQTACHAVGVLPLSGEGSLMLEPIEWFVSCLAAKGNIVVGGCYDGSVVMWRPRKRGLKRRRTD
eukprot:comp17793_c1_seq1/m.17856 comp17793_c1_seq1/g.17856  ORF comp17793_c1_seq1/g.17856 comp17793_c1_seq1/m.17856 type:complete len:516 (-) comp17793_c1_seq1:120-1667(-)